LEEKCKVIFKKNKLDSEKESMFVLIIKNMTENGKTMSLMATENIYSIQEKLKVMKANGDRENFLD
jgi:hypothetical protein